MNAVARVYMTGDDGTERSLGLSKLFRWHVELSIPSYMCNAHIPTVDASVHSIGAWMEEYFWNICIVYELDDDGSTCTAYPTADDDGNASSQHKHKHKPIYPKVNSSLRVIAYIIYFGM